MPMARRPTDRVLGVVVGVVLFAVAGTAVPLALYPGQSTPPLDPAIPNERLLIARGLSGRPAPGQPISPIAVDRVVTDGATTYVQFHTTTALGTSLDPSPSLSDDRGAVVNYGSSTGISPSGWERFLPPWFP